MWEFLSEPWIRLGCYGCLDRETDDSPMDFGVLHFQTNPLDPAKPTQNLGRQIWAVFDARLIT